MTVVDEFWELVELARSDATATECRFDLEAVAAALQNRLQGRLGDGVGAAAMARIARSSSGLLGPRTATRRA